LQKATETVTLTKGDKNMTIQEVIATTGKQKDAKRIQGDINGKFMYLKRYNDCTAILYGKENTNEYFVAELYTVYGPFDDLAAAIAFRKNVLHLHTAAHEQAMWKSWESEGDGFCSAKNAYR
jgi:hypothetical protein